MQPLDESGSLLISPQQWWLSITALAQSSLQLMAISALPPAGCGVSLDRYTD